MCTSACMCMPATDAPHECLCVCKKERRVRGYLQTETNQCVWDKKAAFMVYGNQPPLCLPPPCIITTTYSHDWWNMRLWNPSCFCYHPVFSPLSPLFPFLSIFFLSCSTSRYISPLLCSGQRCLEPCTNKKLHTAWGPSWKYVYAHRHSQSTRFPHEVVMWGMRNAWEKIASSEEEYEGTEEGKGKDKGKWEWVNEKTH